MERWGEWAIRRWSNGVVREKATINVALVLPFFQGEMSEGQRGNLISEFVKNLYSNFRTKL